MQIDATTLSDKDVERELTTLMGHLNAGNYRFLVLLAEFERRSGHVGIGLASCAHWLSWRCGIGLVAAREKVRVARALQVLPRLADAMERGVLSYCKVRALTRIATPENEGLLLSIAEAGTVSHVEKVVRLHRRAERREELQVANERFAERYLACFEGENGGVVIEGRLAPEQGAVLMKAMRAATDVMRELARDSGESSAAPDAVRNSYAASRADALALLAECFLTHGATDVAGPDRQLVTIHVEQAVLRDETAEGRCELEELTSVPPATARRVACDASLIEITENADGEPLKLGRKTRAVSTALRRALHARDRGCRFPGCTNQWFLDAHHVEHWVNGGRTDPDNFCCFAGATTGSSTSTAIRSFAMQVSSSFAARMDAWSRRCHLRSKPNGGVNAYGRHTRRRGLRSTTTPETATGVARRWTTIGHCTGCSSVSGSPSLQPSAVEVRGDSIAQGRRVRRASV